MYNKLFIASWNDKAYSFQENLLACARKAFLEKAINGEWTVEPVKKKSANRFDNGIRKAISGFSKQEYLSSVLSTEFLFFQIL